VAAEHWEFGVLGLAFGVESFLANERYHWCLKEISHRGQSPPKLSVPARLHLLLLSTITIWLSTMLFFSEHRWVVIGLGTGLAYWGLIRQRGNWLDTTMALIIAGPLLVLSLCAALRWF
jgi:hypothetical protein